MSDKWQMIAALSKMSDRYGNLLMDMMREYDVYNLPSLTEAQVSEFYNKTVHAA